MAKRHKPQQDSRIAIAQDERTIEMPKPRVTQFVARDCTACTALRDAKEETKGKSFSRVYSTVGRVRYCKCGFCGNTWKEILE